MFQLLLKSRQRIGRRDIVRKPVPEPCCCDWKQPSCTTETHSTTNGVDNFPKFSVPRDFPEMSRISPELSVKNMLIYMGRRNEYQPKGGDALQLGSKGRYGS